MMNPYESPNIGYQTQISGLEKNYKLKDTHIITPKQKEIKRKHRKSYPIDTH